MKLFLTKIMFVFLLGSLFSGCQPKVTTQEMPMKSNSKEDIDYNSFVSVGGIDPAKAEHVVTLLDSNGIPNIVEGSVVYGVSVAPSDKSKAIALLSADSKNEGYHFNATP